MGESEVREAHLAKSLFYIKISDKVDYIVTGFSNFAAFFDIFAIYIYTYSLNVHLMIKSGKGTETS